MLNRKSKSISIQPIEHQIYIIRGEKVMLDSDLASLYGVSTKVLNQAVKRNIRRFPADFMFQLNVEEVQLLRSQIATSNNRSQIVTGYQKHRDPRFIPYAFTEHGAVMLATILNSPTAVKASIDVVRAFVRLRSILIAHKELARKLQMLDSKFTNEINNVYKLIDQYLKPVPSPKSKIGFRVSQKK